MPPSPSAPKLEYRHNVAAARHEIGVKAGKVFVPFATLSDAYYDQLAQNAGDIAGNDNDDDDEGEA